MKILKQILIYMMQISLDELGRIDVTEDRISEYKDKSIKIIQYKE